jgi:membrane associated rhomboid family serine protease
MAFFDDLKSSMRRQGAPVTVALCVAMVAGGVLTLLAPRLIEVLSFQLTWLTQPWTILTYPFVYVLDGGIGVFFLILTVMWMLWMGGPVERDQGPLRYGLIWVIFTLLGAISLLIGWNVARLEIPAFGPWIPLAALTVIWGFRNRTAAVSLFGVIPMNGFWVALLAVAMLFVDYARYSPVLGAIVCVPLLLAYAFAENKIPGLAYAVPKAVYKPSKAQQLKEAQFFDDVRKREKERDERERLRKLFESSVDEEQ